MSSSAPLPNQRKRGRPSKDKEASDGESEASDNEGKAIFPLARIKKVMRLDPVSSKIMFSSEAPSMMAKAAELFVRDITEKAWEQTQEAGRRTLQRIDVSAAVLASEKFDFLVDFLPAEDLSLVGKVMPVVNGSSDGATSSSSSSSASSVPPSSSGLSVR